MCMNSHTIPDIPSCAWTRNHTSYLATPGSPLRCGQATFRRQTLNMSVMAPAVFLHLRSRWAAGHHTSVREHRTALDWAHEIKYLSDEMYPNAAKIILVMDNFNTHRAASLYKAFPPQEARRIMKRLEIHYTPKHGSWLDMAEIELNVLTRQCLSRRIDNIETLRMEIAAWEAERNREQAKILWHFQNGDARTKLISLYPTIVSDSL